MPRYSDLELALRKTHDANVYAVGLRFNGVGDEAEQRSSSDLLFTIDPAAMRAFAPEAYGQQLGAAFFTEPLKAEFNKFRSLAQSQDSTLRVRIAIESSAPELHGLHWETLSDPSAPDQSLFLGERTIVSRFLASSLDATPVRLRPKTDLRALAVVANPAGLDEYPGLMAVDVPGELEAVRAAMSRRAPGTTAISVTSLAPGGPVTLDQIVDALRTNDGFDILYLVCHGQLLKDTPHLFLDDRGPVPGADLVARVAELNQRPRLIVLASCQSAGKGGVGLAALGPRFADAGIPAVLAMQGNITMETARSFMASFFASLTGDGQIDRAVAIARGAVRHRHDWWMPVVFMRLKEGRIWYTAGFDSPSGEFEHWQSIVEFVRSGECLPILGPDIAEYLNGNSQEVSAQIAQMADFPLDTHDRYDLAKVAQYLAIHNSPQYARTVVRAAFQDRLYKAGERILGRPVGEMAVGPLQDAIAAAAFENDTDPAKRDPLGIVASLNVRVFINATYDTLLESFIRRVPAKTGTKAPISLATNWRDETKMGPAKSDFVEATVATPCVYYVFGKRRQAEEQTWVLTEDDFFDYLIRTTQYKLLPGVVADALVTGSLLFLGFPLDDWKFRVLFRLIMARGGAELLHQFNHVAVQVDPGETTLANARRAKKYLNKYFTDSKIDIYWGTAADFLRELRVQLDQVPVSPMERSE